jgi:hypothetical protein
MHTPLVRKLEAGAGHPTPRWRAECSFAGCGWVGVNRPNEVQARHDATSHTSRTESIARAQTREA